jgi:dynein heavy chain
LPWPEQALVAVSSALITPFQIETTDEIKAQLIDHMGFVHRCADSTCEDYFEKVRRSMYQTPKSYLSFIHSYKKMYTDRLQIIKEQRQNITLGLSKLVEGAKGVEEMKIVLEKEMVKLEVATRDTEKMLSGLQISSMEAKKEADQVDKIKKKCEADATRIAGEKALCEEDLAKAQPFVDEANDGKECRV